MSRTHPAAIRIAGFKIVVSWTLSIVVALIAWSLATQLLPADFPGRGQNAYWAAAAVTTALFLASLLAHELAHAVLARQVAGVEVEDITFWLFGGMSRMRGELPTPWTQLLVTAAGPAASLLLGGAFWLAAVVLAAVGAGGLPAGAALWLALMNLALAVFNLIPGAPLDGGRMLHALLWRFQGSRARGALTAARVGQGTGMVLVGLGLVELLVIPGNATGGLWSALIGWFIIGAARNEARVATARLRLGERRVREIMTPDPAVGPGWYTVDAFLDTFASRHRQAAFPVRDFDGRLVGVVPMTLLGEVPPERRGLLRVRDLAIPLSSLVVAHPDDLAVELALRLAGARQRSALVVEGERVAGLVSPSNLADPPRRAAGLAAGGAGAGGAGAGATPAPLPTSAEPRSEPQ
ncbi:MAG TPA: site-2 protease family protein [Actinomycetota bacterium]